MLAIFVNETAFVAPMMMLTKLYSINLLAILNSRIQILGGRVYGPVGDLESRSLSFLTRGPDATLTPFINGREQNRGSDGQHAGHAELIRGDLYLPLTELQTNDTGSSV